MFNSSPVLTLKNGIRRTRKINSFFNVFVTKKKLKKKAQLAVFKGRQ